MLVSSHACGAGHERDFGTLAAGGATIAVLRECVDAGLELEVGWGVALIAGDVGPFRPYLPSGAYL
jgi:hypothetical protein